MKLCFQSGTTLACQSVAGYSLQLEKSCRLLLGMAKTMHTQDLMGNCLFLRIKPRKRRFAAFLTCCLTLSNGRAGSDRKFPMEAQWSIALATWWSFFSTRNLSLSWQQLCQPQPVSFSLQVNSKEMVSVSAHACLLYLSLKIVIQFHLKMLVYTLKVFNDDAGYSPLCLQRTRPLRLTCREPIVLFRRRHFFFS